MKKLLSLAMLLTFGFGVIGCSQEEQVQDAREEVAEEQEDTMEAQRELEKEKQELQQENAEEATETP